MPAAVPPDFPRLPYFPLPFFFGTFNFRVFVVSTTGSSPTRCSILTLIFSFLPGFSSFFPAFETFSRSSPSSPKPRSATRSRT